MNIKQALDSGAKKLATQKITSARLDAEVILSFVLKKSREFLYTYPEKSLNTFCAQSFNKLIKKRAQNYPVAYITNNKEFFGLDFYVDERVLIPRPETELLVENLLRSPACRQAGSPARDDKLIRIAEIGTGSGCIAISLAKNLVGTRRGAFRIIATDISAKALQVARKNAKKHKVLSKIQFLQGDLLKPITNKKIDIIVANLPYLDDNYAGLEYEPQLALKAGAHGIDLYKKFFTKLAQLKNKPKLVYIEIAHKHPPTLTKMIKKLFPKSDVKTIKDLAGLNRIIQIFL